ncbi:MAG TPA: hypothetical protein V6D37_00540 [Candidatus Sericytochromatia bacterium]|jgi:serine/threonine-protein kinase
MKSRTIPEGELITSFLGHAVVGFFLIYSPLWAVSFAFAFVLTGAGGRVLLKVIPMAWFEVWSAFMPLGWIGAWAFFVVMAISGLGVLAGAFTGVVAWFVFWGVSRRIAFAFAGTQFGAVPVLVVFAVTGAVNWFAFGAVAGSVAMAVKAGQFWTVAVVVAWAWAWTWAWFVFEALGGVFLGSLAWAVAGIILGAVFGVKLGVVIWAWTLTGVVAGSVSGAVSDAGNALLLSFSKFHTFAILAFMSLSGLGLGWLSGRVLVPSVVIGS